MIPTILHVLPYATTAGSTRFLSTFWFCQLTFAGVSFRRLRLTDALTVTSVAIEKNDGVALQASSAH